MTREKIEALVSKHYKGEFFMLVCDGLQNSYSQEPFIIDEYQVNCALQDVIENNHLAGATV